MLRRLRRFLWRLVPHRCRWAGFASKYGCSAWCVRCGRGGGFMDAYPWGD